MQCCRAAADGELEFEPITLVPTAAAFALSGLPCGGLDALVGGFAGAGLGDVLAPCVGAVGAALVVAVQ